MKNSEVIMALLAFHCATHLLIIIYFLYKKVYKIWPEKLKLPLLSNMSVKLLRLIRQVTTDEHLCSVHISSWILSHFGSGGQIKTLDMPYYSRLNNSDGIYTIYIFFHF